MRVARSRIYIHAAFHTFQHRLAGGPSRCLGQALADRGRSRDAPIRIGFQSGFLGAAIGRAVPGTMVMGATGMAEMSRMAMDRPRNSISMSGGEGPHGTIDMGGMFTLLKIRDRLTGDGDPGWYKPRTDVAGEASDAELARDGIAP